MRQEALRGMETRMCKYCEPVMYDGEESMYPLPSDEDCGAEMMLCKFEDFGWVIGTVEIPPSFAPIDYCPKCGRKLS